MKTVALLVLVLLVPAALPAQERAEFFARGRNSAYYPSSEFGGDGFLLAVGEEEFAITCTAASPGNCSFFAQVTQGQRVVVSGEIIRVILGTIGDMTVMLTPRALAPTSSAEEFARHSFRGINVEPATTPVGPGMILEALGDHYQLVCLFDQPPGCGSAIATSVGDCVQVSGPLREVVPPSRGDNDVFAAIEFFFELPPNRCF